MTTTTITTRLFNNINDAIKLFTHKRIMAFAFIKLNLKLCHRFHDYLWCCCKTLCKLSSFDDAVESQSLLSWTLCKVKCCAKLTFIDSTVKCGSLINKHHLRPTAFTLRKLLFVKPSQEIMQLNLKLVVVFFSWIFMLQNFMQSSISLHLNHKVLLFETKRRKKKET